MVQENLSATASFEDFGRARVRVPCFIQQVGVAWDQVYVCVKDVNTNSEPDGWPRTGNAEDGYSSYVKPESVRFFDNGDLTFVLGPDLNDPLALDGKGAYTLCLSSAPDTDGSAAESGPGVVKRSMRIVQDAQGRSPYLQASDARRRARPQQTAAAAAAAPEPAAAAPADAGETVVRQVNRGSSMLIRILLPLIILLLLAAAGVALWKYLRSSADPGIASPGPVPAQTAQLPAEPDPEPQVSEPEPDPEPQVSEPEPNPEPQVSEPEPEPDPAAQVPEPAAGDDQAGEPVTPDTPENAAGSGDPADADAAPQSSEVTVQTENAQSADGNTPDAAGADNSAGGADQDPQNEPDPQNTQADGAAPATDNSGTAADGMPSVSPQIGSAEIQPSASGAGTASGGTVHAGPAQVCSLGSSNDDRQLLAACMKSSPSADTMGRLVDEALEAGRCDLAKRLMSSLGRSQAEFALRYARLADPGSAVQNPCVSKDSETAVYWYGKAGQGDQGEAAEALRRLKP